MAKEHFREHFRDYVNDRLKTSFDTLNDKQRSIRMTRYYADGVLRPLNPTLVPEADEDLDACVIDGKDDCGVDFLSREGNSVLIIQAKYGSAKKSGKRSPEKAETFDYFCGVLSRLYAGPSQFVMNQKLREGIADIDWHKDNFLLHYITLQRPAGNAIRSAERGIDPLPEIRDLGDRSSVELLDEENLNIRLRDALMHETSLGKTVAVMFSPDDENAPWLCFEDPSSGRKSYLGRVTGVQLAELFRRNRSGLFTLN